MNLFHKKSVPQPDLDTARRILDHVFERNHYEPNSVPLELLASYSNYRRERFSLQRTILVIMMVLFALLPLLFIPPSFTLSSDTGDNEWNPVFQLSLDTFMLVDRLNVRIEGRNIPVYEVDSHVYSIEPTKNGQMDITVTLLNQQVLTQSVSITNVDKESPVISDYWVEDGLLYINLSDVGSGVDYDGILAENMDGEKVAPTLIEGEAGYIAFESPRQLSTISIPDRAGNSLEVMIVLQ